MWNYLYFLSDLLKGWNIDFQNSIHNMILSNMITKHLKNLKGLSKADNFDYIWGVDLKIESSLNSKINIASQHTACSSLEAPQSAQL